MLLILITGVKVIGVPGYWEEQRCHIHLLHIASHNYTITPYAFGRVAGNGMSR